MFTATQRLKTLLCKRFENKNVVSHQKIVCSRLLLWQLTFTLFGATAEPK
jgi:hypothetical protein